MTLLYAFYYRYWKALILFFVLVSFSGFAQPDDLRELVQGSELEKLARLENWFNQKLFYSEPSNRIELLQELERIALKENDKTTLASTMFYRGLYVIAMDNHQHKKGITLMQKAIASAEKNRQQLQVAYFKHSLGYYYFIHAKDPAEALHNMLQAHYIFDRIGYDYVYNQSAMLDRLGFVYYHLHNFNEAIKYFKLSLNYPMENTRRHIGILNSIGQSYRELFNPNSAYKYFRLSLQKAVLVQDIAWIGINSGNLGWYYINEKSYTNAKPLMQEYYKCGLAVNDPELIIEALTGLGDISLNSGNTDLALHQLKEAKILLDQSFKSGNMPVQNYVRKQYLYTIFAKVWDAKGNTVQALDYLKEANKIKDSLSRRSILSKNTSIQQMFEAEQTNSRMQLLRDEKQAAETLQYLYISLGILLTIVIGLLRSRELRERKIQKQKEALLQLEKEMAEGELQSSREQLEEYIHSLRKKSKLIENIQSEMNLLQKQNQIPVEDEQVIFHKLSIATILTEEDWNHFRILFEKVHIGFFMKLKTTYPDLTPGEIRLCSLLKLGFNSHQMAAMMGISTVSIKKNRQRLRKKTNLSKSQKLEELFISF